MGCFNSKSTAEKSKDTDSKQKSKGGKTATDKKNNVGKNGAKTSSKSNEPTAPEARPDAAAASTNNVEPFLLSVLEPTESFLNSLPDSQTTKQFVAVTFMNSCAEVARTKFRMKIDNVIEALSDATKKHKLTLLHGAVSSVEERNMDDGFTRILLAWCSNNATFTNKIPAEAGQIVLDTLYIRYRADKPLSFGDVLLFYFNWISVNQAAAEVFTKYADSKETMSKEQLARFLRETQRVEVTDRQIVEKLKYRYGGHVHRYNFVSYNGSVLTNNAIDPARTSDVWQDMTQSFPHYFVACARIRTDEDLKRAWTDGSRALVLDIKKGNGDTLMCGSCSLQSVLDGVKKNGFTTNTYPIVLCLPSKDAMPIDVQAAVAKMITETLGPLLSKGLMFEGAVLNDPKFSPGAVRKKVLIMCDQGQLKPFVGFLVADMNKDGLGVRVTDVVDGTPASKGGVLKDDWLTHINGQNIRNKQHLRECLAKIQVGEEFTVRRENLDELKIVVGGAVDPKDTSLSPELSAIAFFSYAKEGSGKYKPWETVRMSAEGLSKSNITRKDLDDHFAIVSVSNVAANGPDLEGLASRMGIQFIDTDSSERSLAWARGRFSDNGRCGYVLRTVIEPEAASDLTVSIICGPRAIHCAPLATGTVRVHGMGSARQSGSQITFSGYDQSTIAVVDMTFDVDGQEMTYTASFCPGLFRSGYRVIPTVPKGEEHLVKRAIHGVYCFAKRT